MQTYTGIQFWPIDPRIEEVRIVDIAHSLSNQCRYAGHCSSFYSVAQHSIMVSNIVPPEDAMWGLLHDAAEAYLVDLPRPIKRYSTLGDYYRKVEFRLMLTIIDRFHLSSFEPDSVKLADNIALMTEMRDLMPNPPAKRREDADPLEDIIVPLSPVVCKELFLRRFKEVGGL